KTIHHAQVDDLRAPVRRNQALAGGDRRCGMFDGTRHDANVFRRADLFCKEKMERFDLTQDDRGHRRAWTGVEIHGEVQIGTETFPQHLHMCFTARLILAPVSTHSSKSGSWNLSAVTPAALVWPRNSRASARDHAEA